MPSGKDVPCASLDSSKDPVMEALEEESFDFQKTEMATRLRTELDKRMNSDQSQVLVLGCNAPRGISHMVHYIMGEFSHRKAKAGSADDQPKTAAYLEAQRKYREYFVPGEIKFTFPKEASKLPSPHYHALQKTSYIHVDWEMSHPGADLCCYECHEKEKDPGEGVKPRVKLAHDRTNFTKNRNLFPIFDQGGSVIWASVMVYCCPQCSTRYPGNDGRLLQMLDPQVRQAYPVHPRYALEGATWHLTKELSDDLDDTMLTYGNGDFFSRKMYNRKFRDFEERLENYFHCLLGEEVDEEHECYIPMRDWIGEFPPPGEALRTLHERAQRSSLNQIGMSNYQRHKLEIQSVGSSKVFSIDWTFAVLRNYTLAGAKACFTSMVETGEVCAMGLVGTTKVEEAAHMVEQTRRRPHFRPQAVFTDTWPHNQDFWFLIFGPIIGCLGIFHFMKRMVDTLRSTHCKYWEAMIALKDSIYEYEIEDYKNLLNALKTGKMAKNKRCYSDNEIKELRHSKKFKQRYAKYLRKRLHSSFSIIQKLLDFEERYRNCKDPVTGQKLFTVDTHDAIKNQIKHVQDIQFPEGMDMYRKVPPGPRSTHNLNCYRSINPEPMLESWHGRFAHMGNTGMRAGLADCLHLRGAAEGNVVVRHKLAMMNEETIYTLTDKLDPPGHLRDRPVLIDHCLGKHLNDLAGDAGCKLPYRNLRAIHEDNGEVFLSEYFQEQQKRNEDARDRPDPKTKRCRCRSCGGNPVLLVNEALEREIPAAAEEEVETVVEQHDRDTGETRTLRLVVTTAQYSVTEGLNVARPIPTVAPRPIATVAPRPSATAVTPQLQTEARVHQFAENEICCLPFLDYKAHERMTGKRRPGPKPHDKTCRHCRQRKKKNMTSEEVA
jgi:hypothetical protein